MTDRNTLQVESPCVRNCCLDNNDICLGCFRSLDEIRQWSTAEDQIRKEFLLNTEKRRENKSGF